MPRLGISGPGAGLPLLRTVDELVAFCTEQHATRHAEDDVARAKAERLWRSLARSRVLVGGRRVRS